MNTARPLFTPATSPDASNPLQLGVGAANDATAAVTLDGLVARHGSPGAGYRFLAFARFDADAALALGQKVASERILRAVPGFVQSAAQSWGALGEASRKRVVGFAPGLLAVLLDEAVTLRDFNDRYDRAAKHDTLSRARTVSQADETARAVRHGYAQSLRMLREYVSAEQWASLGFATLAENPDGADRLVLALDTLGSQTAAWLATLPPEVRDACDAMGVGEGLVATLQANAETLRRTQAELAGLTDSTRVTQRQLDAQDGRVLHLVRVIFTAFRVAARHDASIVLPDLGDVETVFVRDRRASTDEEPADPQPTPAPEPAPQPG